MTHVSAISDTAYWVALYRAVESRRPDALFRDDLAGRLAGARGRDLAAGAPGYERNATWVAMRTRLIDASVMEAVRGGCRCVLNLATGLDTRPYRLDVPSTLRWVEVDLPAVVVEKECLLVSDVAKCSVDRIGLDVTEWTAVESLLMRLSVDGPVIVITEGLLGYLTEDAVGRLIKLLCSTPSVQSWILELASPGVLQSHRRAFSRHLRASPLRFAPSDGVTFFERDGWRVKSVESLFDAAIRFGRASLGIRLAALLPKPNVRELGRRQWSGIVSLARPSSRGAEAADTPILAGREP